MQWCYLLGLVCSWYSYYNELVIPLSLSISIMKNPCPSNEAQLPTPNSTGNGLSVPSLSCVVSNRGLPYYKHHNSMDFVGFCWILLAFPTQYSVLAARNWIGAPWNPTVWHGRSMIAKENIYTHHFHCTGWFIGILIITLWFIIIPI